MRRIDRVGVKGTEERFNLNDFAAMLNYNSAQYPLGMTSYGSEKAEAIENNFTGYVQTAYKSNGVVFAVILARLMLFTEARFKWRDLVTEKLYGSQALLPLEKPWPNGTTGDLLARMEQDASLAGNFYGTTRYVDGQRRIRRMRPDWVKVIVGSPSGDPDDLDSNPVGYLYYAGGLATKNPVVLLPEQVAHYAPIPDPLAQFRGMSWLTPVISEIQADGMATKHKRKFFENAATPNLSVSLAKELSPEAFKQFVELMNKSHVGADNAYKTLYTGGGADVKVIGADMKQIDFKVTQGAGETRIAAAGGVPPVVVGLSEGLGAATYSNYGQARRQFGDQFARPSWRNAAASLARLVEVPADAELWYDDSRVSFLREDVKDAAETASLDAATIRQYIDAGFVPQSAVDAVTSGNLDLLQHSGLVSVQLHDPKNPAAPAA